MRLRDWAGKLVLLLVALSVVVADGRGASSPAVGALESGFAIDGRSEGLGSGRAFDRFYVHRWPDPVNVRNGNLFLYYRDLNLPSARLALKLERYYNSRSVYPGPLGHGWTFTYYSFVVPEADGSLTVHEPDGSTSTYLPSSVTASGDRWESVSGDSTIVRSRGGGGYSRLLETCAREDFDAQGRLVSVADNNGAVIRLRYDTLGRLESIEDLAGRRLRFDYDEENLIVAVEYPPDRKITYQYDGRKNLMSVVDALGGATRFAYDDLHNLSQITYPDDSTTRFTYDRARDMVIAQEGPGSRHTTYSYDSGRGPSSTTVSDSAGRETRYLYESLASGVRLTKVDPLDHRHIYEYDVAGNLVREIDKRGAVAKFSYDENNRLIKLTDPLGGTMEISYCATCAGHLVESVTDRRGHKTVNAYDDRGNLSTITDALGQTTRLEYDATGSLVKVILPGGDVTSLKYGKEGNPIEISSFSGEKRSLEYDLVGRLTRVTDSRGRSSGFRYDERDRLVESTDPLGRRRTFGYDALGRLDNVTLPSGYRQRFSYDDSGYLRAISDDAGVVQRLRSDPEGNVLAVTGRDGSHAGFAHDGRGRVREVSGPYGETIKFGYDPMSNLVRASGPGVGEYRFRYDMLGRLVEGTDSKELRVELVYDAEDNLLSFTDQAGHRSRFEYDALHRITAMTDPLGNRVQLFYDQRGNLRSALDPRRNRWMYEHDTRGLLTSVQDALGNSRSFGYGAEGELAWSKNARGQIVSYEYDRAGQLIESRFDDRALSKFHYDQLGRIVRASNPDASYAFQYDARGNLVQVRRVMLGVSLRRELDAADTLVRLSDGNGPVVSYSHDRNERIQSITNRFGETFRFEYTGAGLRHALLYPNGVESRYEYDDRGNLARLAIVGPGSQTLKSYEYGYEARGYLDRALEDETTLTRYSYDALGRLASETDGTGRATTWEYDATGNRIRKVLPDGSRSDYVYAENNQLIGGGGTTYAYDQDGNLIARSGPDGTTRFSYDAEDFLVGAQLPDGTTVRYGYGPFGERVYREVDGARETYLYYNEDLLRVLGPSGATRAEYTHGPGFDTPLSVREAGESLFFHQDRTGNVVLVTDARGSVVQQNRFDGFGAVLEGDFDSALRFGFNGKQYDAELGLYYFFNRYYDPGVGRFIQWDPLAPATPATNAYLYVGSNPVNAVDPLGLEFKGLGHMLGDFFRGLGPSDDSDTSSRRALAEGRSPGRKGLIDRFMESMNFLSAKQAGQRMLAQDSGLDGKGSDVEGTFGIKLRAGLGVKVEVGEGGTPGKVKLEAIIETGPSIEAKALMGLKKKGAKSVDDVVGISRPFKAPGDVNVTHGPDGAGAQVRVKVPNLTIKLNVDGDGVSGGKVEVGPGIGMPPWTPRGKGTLGRYKTEVDPREFRKKFDVYRHITDRLERAVGSLRCE